MLSQFFISFYAACFVFVMASRDLRKQGRFLLPVLYIVCLLRLLPEHVLSLLDLADSS
jgi:hypothetical protein